MYRLCNTYFAEMHPVYRQIGSYSTQLKRSNYNSGVEFSCCTGESFDAHYILQIISESCDYSQLILSSVHSHDAISNKMVIESMQC